MKKYIIISGVPRAGKSTVSKLLAKQFGYQHFSMDSVLEGIESKAYFRKRESIRMRKRTSRKTSRKSAGSWRCLFKR